MKRQGHGESVPFADVELIGEAGPAPLSLVGGDAAHGVSELRDSLLLFIAGILLVPLAIVGFLGLTLLFLPLLGLRGLFPRRSTPLVLRRGHDASPDFGVGDDWDATIRRAPV